MKIGAKLVGKVDQVEVVDGGWENEVDDGREMNREKEKGRKESDETTKLVSFRSTNSLSSPSKRIELQTVVSPTAELQTAKSQMFFGSTPTTGDVATLIFCRRKRKEKIRRRKGRSSDSSSSDIQLSNSDFNNNNNNNASITASRPRNSAVDTPLPSPPPRSSPVPPTWPRLSPPHPTPTVTRHPTQTETHYPLVAGLDSARVSAKNDALGDDAEGSTDDATDDASAKRNSADDAADSGTAHGPTKQNNNAGTSPRGKDIDATKTSHLLFRRDSAAAAAAAAAPSLSSSTISFDRAKIRSAKFDAAADATADPGVSAPIARRIIAPSAFRKSETTTPSSTTTTLTTTTTTTSWRTHSPTRDLFSNAILFLVVYSALAALPAQGDAKIESECSNSYFIRALPLRCEKGTTIKILSAFYGWWFANRQDHGCSFRPGDCTRNTTQPRRCNGKQNCLVKVEYGFSWWGPCDPSMHDYLQVHYECIPVIPASNPSDSSQGDTRSVVTETYGPRIGTEHAIAVAIGIALVMLIVVVISWYVMKYQSHKRRSDSDADSQSDEDDVDFRPDLIHDCDADHNPVSDARRPRRELTLGRRGRILAPLSSSSSRASSSRYICAPSRPSGERGDGQGFTATASPDERTVTVDNYYNNFHEKTATVTYKVATKNIAPQYGPARTHRPGNHRPGMPGPS